ncbi:short-chain dehydrogenase [Psychroflexus sp. CAK57W]|uniref:NAD(P)-binding domain-containing protein n=1 Tax=Psychroflexus curvus TaxID=2873595 RepID=UPI001CCB2F8A|nr:NAD(P)-binding domain-containing protein [Psychroflexus curvus]MBZ9787297.1 short-chain dehydrogenase [Psychroflexus curvus]
MQKQISILGCGWLGLPLAKHLIQNGWEVKGSTTSSEKMKNLEAEGVQAYNIELQEDRLIGNISGFLEGSELLIIAIPPGLRRHPHSDFVSKLERFTTSISDSKVKNIIYVSSSAVFKDHESYPSFTEHYRFTPGEVEESQLIQAEQLLLNLNEVKTSVIRFGGLVGKERHPVNYLSGKTGIKNPEAPVNLIHLEHCILLISEIIQQKKLGKVFHGVEEIQLSKEKFYTRKAKEFNLPAPEFDHSQVSVGKEISMTWTSRELGIKLSKKV